MRRILPILAMLLAMILPAQAAAPVYPSVAPGQPLHFPQDFGAHPDYRTEWWYVTGWLRTPQNKPLGFQLTFFRVRPALDQANPSHFAPKQLLFAHAALSDPVVGKLLFDQRAARAGFGLAEAASGDTSVHIDNWRLQRAAGGRYQTKISTRDFMLQLELQPTEPPVLEGDEGYSRKGPLVKQASYYYSQPQLKVSGTVTRLGQPVAVTGDAWLDHEWASEPLPEQAAGWDWTGLNFNDGSALMLLQIRNKNGATFWASGTWRDAHGHSHLLPANQVSLTPLRRWHSLRTGVDYPVAMRVRAGSLQFELAPLLDDQELDSRATTGAVYWEGAVTAQAAGKAIGHGYLELTGYRERLVY
jgi:predicted secreted hydrolase